MEGPEKYKILIKDKILFEPYMDDGYIATIPYKRNKTISIRYKGKDLITDNVHPFEVIYPGNNGIATGYQTAIDVFRFISPNIKFENIV